MFSITIAGITYPCFFRSEGEAMEAAYKFYEHRSRMLFKIIRAATNNNSVMYVLQDNKGRALPISLDRRAA